MAKPTPEQLSDLANAICAAATLICGKDCAVAALALVQAQCKVEAHVLNEHDLTEDQLGEFREAIAGMKAKAVRAIAKHTLAADIKTNAAGGVC